MFPDKLIVLHDGREVPDAVRAFELIFPRLSPIRILRHHAGANVSSRWRER